MILLSQFDHLVECFSDEEVQINKNTYTCSFARQRNTVVLLLKRLMKSLHCPTEKIIYIVLVLGYHTGRSLHTKKAFGFILEYPATNSMHMTTFILFLFSSF